MLARERQDPLSISVVNLTEVLIAPAAEASKLAAAREAIAALGIAIHQPSEAIAVDAARLRGHHPISLSDAYLLATARYTGSTIASFDRKVQDAAEREGLIIAPVATPFSATLPLPAVGPSKQPSTADSPCGDKREAVNLGRPLVLGLGRMVAGRSGCPAVA